MKASHVRLIMIGIAAAVLAGLSATPSSADNFGSEGTFGSDGQKSGVWFTPDSNWHVINRALTSTYATAASSVLATQYAPTRLALTYTSSGLCGTGGGPYDLCLYDDQYGDNGFSGWNACHLYISGTHPNQTCGQQWVRINLTYSPPANFVMCHEIGHSVGLRHTTSTQSCMNTGNTSQVLAQHDKDHINSRY